MIDIDYEYCIHMTLDPYNLIAQYKICSESFRRQHCFASRLAILSLQKSLPYEWARFIRNYS